MSAHGRRRRAARRPRNQRIEAGAERSSSSYQSSNDGGHGGARRRTTSSSAASSSGAASPNRPQIGGPAPKPVSQRRTRAAGAASSSRFQGNVFTSWRPFNRRLVGLCLTRAVCFQIGLVRAWSMYDFVHGQAMPDPHSLHINQGRSLYRQDCCKLTCLNIHGMNYSNPLRVSC